MNTRDYVDLRIEQLKLKGSDSASKAFVPLFDCKSKNKN